MDTAVQESVRVLKGVGPQLAEKLGRLGIEDVADVLFHLPLRYQDKTRFAAIGELRPGTEALIVGRVEASGVRYGRRRSLMTVISDDTGRITMRQFHFSQSQSRGLSRDRFIQCYGEVRSGPAGLEMVHPEYRLLEDREEASVEAALTPVYPTTEGVG
ncbi:MAG: OB-fold nucleic acid binding domain-containing protein, partial [Pseudomonadota bacterium]|nr:OB-fold nucleic acid binding domain-containing protein [Pseudomonadota bacterium]